MENNYLKEQYYYSPDVPFFVDSLKSKEAKKAFFQRQEDLSTKVWLGTSRAKLKGDTREVESGAKWLAMSFEHHLKNGDIDGAAGRAKVITSPSGENIYIVMPVRTTKAFFTARV